MGSYYYLISGLPEVKLSDAKAKYDINEITQSILSSLNAKDSKFFKYLIYQNDNKNLVSAIAKQKGLFTPYIGHIEPSIFSKEEMQKYASISNLPLYMSKFLEDSKNIEWENARHIENTLLNLYYEEMIQNGNSFIKNYALFMRDMKNVLAALNGRALGFSSDAIAKELIGDYSLISALTKSTASDFGVGREIPYINTIIETFNSSDKADPYNMENIECSLVREFLDRLTSIKSFTTDNVFAYYINLTYAVSINGRNEEEGKKHLETLIGSLKEKASVYN
ncbi:DUF2764 family protein [Brachyspira hampsonii]|uniref:DUF2764 family protein n=1 Tax=Brachyspira hampsonii 30446 TaxID=1289135 RepID=A0A2U4FA46_9SPIR|nr:DUF2764 family protein [Brachyspira hampsonii]EKV58330.1 hypothetical protein A966_01060 [Brachyspira hampsonii 30446]MBW5388937.1 DUF2764 family protein [Brachyspira hampsonii]MBW5393418.1 DUF2764 family protein [Brachyspira hampsonii]OEJ16558.1 hypothetical protein A9495_09000 [Brachyspira hampsonii]PTY39284.1 hypothetical protein DQ06_01200 [Brachyspira hampsonii bv. II]